MKCSKWIFLYVRLLAEDLEKNVPASMKALCYFFFRWKKCSTLAKSDERLRLARLFSVDHPKGVKRLCMVSCCLELRPMRLCMQLLVPDAMLTFGGMCGVRWCRGIQCLQPTARKMTHISHIRWCPTIKGSRAESLGHITFSPTRKTSTQLRGSAEKRLGCGSVIRE